MLLYEKLTAAQRGQSILASAADLSVDHGTASAVGAVLLHLTAALGHGWVSPGSALR